MEIREGQSAFKEIFSRCFFSEKRGKSGCYFLLLSSFRCATPCLSASAAKFSTAGKDLAVFKDARARFCDRSPENNSCRMTSADTFLEVTLHLVSNLSVGGDRCGNSAVRNRCGHAGSALGNSRGNPKKRMACRNRVLQAGGMICGSCPE